MTSAAQWKYFAPMLHEDDDDLDPYEYRLLGHYRRVCGQSGVCSEGTRTTADRTRISIGKVSQVRAALKAKGRIHVDETREPFAVTLVDRWAANIARYEAESPVENPPPSVQNSGTPVNTRSAHEQDADEDRSPDEQPVENPGSVHDMNARSQDEDDGIEGVHHMNAGSPDEQSPMNARSPHEHSGENRSPHEHQTGDSVHDMNSVHQVNERTSKDAAATTALENDLAAAASFARESPPDGPDPTGMIFALYEANIGELTPVVRDDLVDALKEYPVAWIDFAIREAAGANARRWNYITAILDRLKRDGGPGSRPRSEGWRPKIVDRNAPTQPDPDDPKRYLRGEFAHLIEH